MKKTLVVLGTVLGLYLIGRALAEPFVILRNPTSYSDDWGGPSLAGVLLVHCGPGALSAFLIYRAVRASWRRRTQARLG